MRFLGLLALLAAPAFAQDCGSTSAGFEAFKRDFAPVAARYGVRQRGLAALAGARYSDVTIRVDRMKHHSGGTLQQIMNKRGVPQLIRQGRQRLARNPGFYAALERAYGVQPEVILAIHGLESNYGSTMGKVNIVDSITTVAFDCRRPNLFRPHLVAALRLVDQGSITARSVGAAHGEWGHTQFLANNVLRYGVDADRDGRVDLSTEADALASTANYLAQNGWQRGGGYQPGTHNFRVFNAWNEGPNYQRMIAHTAAGIRG